MHEEEGQPTDDEASHDDAECFGRLALAFDVDSGAFLGQIGRFGALDAERVVAARYASRCSCVVVRRVERRLG